MSSHIHTHTQLYTQKMRAHSKHTPVHVCTRWLTQACVPDPNPGTHTFLIPHNCFQSKGSCLSGPRRGLIARYKILRREGKAAGRGEREREREMCLLFFSSLSLFFSSCTCAGIWCLLKKKKKKGFNPHPPHPLCEVNPTDSGGKHLA